VNFYLLEKNFAAEYRRAIESFYNNGFPLLITEQKIQGLISQSQESKKLYEVNEQNEALIKISGVLTNKRSWIDSFLGYAASLTYDEIIQAIAEANADPYVKNIKLIYDTPGGAVMGCDDAAVAIAMSEKPTEAIVRGMMCSGGYYLGSQADKITAISEGAVIGSIGVMVSFYNEPDKITITSSNAPKKSPYDGSKKGNEIIREELDEMEAMFYQRISEGRKVSAEVIKENYGQGGTMLAKRALEAGMIDKIETSRMTLVRRASMTSDSEANQSVDITKLQPDIVSLVVPSQKIEGGFTPLIQTNKTESSPSRELKKEKKRMDIKTLENEHPDVFAQALKLGEERGRKLEAERIQAFQDYMDADPDNEKLQVICKTEMSAGKTVEQVRPKLDVAIRDGKLEKNANAGAVGTTTVDTAEEIAKKEAEAKALAESGNGAEVYDVNKRFAEIKAAGGFKV